MSCQRETPQQAAHRLLSLAASKAGAKLQGVLALHAYRYADGSLYCYRVRGVLDDGSKFLRPMMQVGNGYKLGEGSARPEGKPLYRLADVLASPHNVPVVVCEGEKCCDLLAGRGVVAVTSGAADSARRADWSPLAGRDVVIWRDADNAGAVYADVVDGLVRKQGCDVQRIDVAALGLSGKDDCEQWLDRYPDATATQVYALPVLEPLNGAVLLDAVRDHLQKFVAYPDEHALDASVLWVVHTHALHLFDNTPRLAHLSAEPGSGKSRALEVLGTLVPNPVQAFNVSAAYLFRKIGGDDPITLLFDEVDAVFGPRAGEHEDLRALLNAGYRKGATTGRCEKFGNEVRTVDYPAFGAVALAGLGTLPDTLLSRCVVIPMRRRSPTEKVTPYRPRLHDAAGHALRDQLAIWTRCAWPTGSLYTYPELPEGVDDRAADLWEPLLSIADAAGGVWPQRARLAAAAMVKEAKATPPSLGLRLLADLRTVFGARDSLPTEAILIALMRLDESPWADMRGKPLDSRGLSQRLKAYGVQPKTLRIGGQTPRGYERAALADAWERYLPSSPENSETSKTPTATASDQSLSPTTLSATPATAATGARDGADVVDVADTAMTDKWRRDVVVSDVLLVSDSPGRKRDSIGDRESGEV